MTKSSSGRAATTCSSSTSRPTRTRPRWEGGPAGGTRPDASGGRKQQSGEALPLQVYQFALQAVKASLAKQTSKVQEAEALVTQASCDQQEVREPPPPPALPRSRR